MSKKLGFWVVTIILAFPLVWLSVLCFNQQKIINQLQSENLKANTEAKNTATTLSKYKYTPFGDYFVTDLKESGLADPISNIVADISKQIFEEENYFPYPGLNGSRVLFDKDKVIIVNEKWVLAEFSDGHYAGIALFEYEIENGKIQWKLINSCVNGMTKKEFQEFIKSLGYEAHF